MLVACRPGAAEQQALRKAARERGTVLDPVWASAAPATAAPATAAPANAAPPSAGDSAAVHGAGTPWRRALALLGEMRLRGMAPDVRTYASAIELSARALMPGEALRLLTTMRREDGLEPNVFCYLAAASACARAAGIGGAGSPHAALHATAAVRLLWSSEAALARESRDDEDTREARAAPAAAGGGGGGRRRARAPPGGDDGDTPRGRTHRTAMTALRDAGAPAALLHASLAAQMRRGVRPSERSIELVLSALVSAREWRLARSALGRLAESGVPVTAAHVKALCDGEGGAAGGWSVALEQLQRTRVSAEPLPFRATAYVLGAALRGGDGWAPIEALGLDAVTESGSARGVVAGSSTDQKVAAAVFCAAAQRSGVSSGALASGELSSDLPTLLWRLRKAGATPTASLFETAIGGVCAPPAAAASSDAAATAVCLLQMAVEARISLRPDVVAAALRAGAGTPARAAAEAPAPAEASGEAGPEERAAAEAAVRELTRIVSGAGAAADGDALRLCGANEAAAAHAQHALARVRASVPSWPPPLPPREASRRRPAPGLNGAAHDGAAPDFPAASAGGARRRGRADDTEVEYSSMALVE